MITNISNRILLCVELGGTQINPRPSRQHCLFSSRLAQCYWKIEFAECNGKQELSFLNLPAEFGMFVSLRGDLYSQNGILQLNNGFNSQ